MSKDISTVPGKVYVVTLSQAGTLSGVTDAGRELVLASSDAAGQVSFQAVSHVTVCSDDGATVLPFCDAPLPIGVDGGASAKQVSQMVDSALFDASVTQYRTIEGEGNASLHWLHLDARRVPAGSLQAIEIPCRSNAAAGVCESPVWLVLWERPEDGADWVVVGSSVSPVQQVAGQTARWEFDGVTLSGRVLRICASDEPGVWSDDQWLGVRMAPREDGEESSGRGSANVHQVTDLTFELVEMLPKFASSADIAAHAADASLHVSAEERARWEAAAAVQAAPASHVGDATHLQNGGQKLVVKGMDGGTKFTLQGLLTNAQVTGSALHVNVPDFTQRSTSVCLYSNADTASYIPWFAAAIDATPLEAFGITEPGVHVGHAGYPLRLKGGVVSINGTNIDAAALAQLAAHKDELLALLAGVPENASAGDGAE